MTIITMNSNNLTENDICSFFIEQPIFERKENSSLDKYGWPSTKNGLYSITDMYHYFEEKGFDKNKVDDIIHKSFHKQYYINIPETKKEILHIMYVHNYNPDLNKKFPYYFYSITYENAFKLKKEYEDESYEAMKIEIDRRKNIRKSLSLNKKDKRKKV